jgi:hypothetical protein
MLLKLAETEGAIDVLGFRVWGLGSTLFSFLLLSAFILSIPYFEGADHVGTEEISRPFYV